MGNSSSSSGRSPHDETVDQGSLLPQGVYSGPQDWNQPIVSQHIVDRKLAPFYRPLEDFNDDWDDDQILAARKEFPEHSDSQAETQSQHESTPPPRPAHHHKRAASVKEVNKQLEASVYKGAVECPICFLYYPPNINRSRCCDQPICTECFVQIKRSEPTATHLVSEPAACPYCVQENFGVTYTPPLWRTGIGSESPQSVPPRSSSRQSVETNGIPRRKSFSADSEEVVTIDQIRPDWEAKLAAVRAAVARRANRRIIMRQVGDRLIPVGVTSGRIHTLTGDGTPAEQGEQPEGSTENRGGRRSRRRHQQQQEINQFLGSMGLGGQDLEELMIMEAMRLSLLEHEEQQRREAEKRQKDSQNSSEAQETDTQVSGAVNSGTSPQPIPSAPVTIPSEIDPQNASQRSNRSGLTPSSVPGNSQLSISAGNSQTFLAPPTAGGSTLAVPISTPLVPDVLTPLSVSPQSRTRSPSPQPRRSGESSLPDPPNTDTSSEPQDTGNASL